MSNNVLHEVPQRLYDSEINFGIACFWDAGFAASLGDSMNGYRWKGEGREYDEVLKRLATAALEHFPDSSFATWWRSFVVERGA